MNYGGSIDFSNNWNGKLFCRHYTTLRPRWDDFYKVDHWYMIALKGNCIGPAYIIDIKHYKLSQLNEFIARIDTGLSLADTKDILMRMYAKHNFNWQHQEFSFILLDQCEKKIFDLPLELYGFNCEHWPGAPKSFTPQPEQTNLFAT